MSNELKEKEKKENSSDVVTNVIASGNSNLKSNFKRDEIRNRKANRLVR